MRDTDGVATDVSIDFGDGQSAVPIAARPVRTCPAGATAELVELRHTYARPGTFTARAAVVTGGCGASRERVEAVRTTTVRARRR